MKQKYIFPEGIIMSKWSRAAVLLTLCALLFSMLPLTLTAEPTAPTAPSLSAQSAVLIEAQSGKVITEKNKDARLPMASTTKIMTALVALELAEPRYVITVDARAVGVEGSSIYLVEGEQLTLEQLIYALLLESANDAATAIAIGLCGSVEAFAAKMNEKALALGLQNTHFENPHGLDGDSHYTTAQELAVIAQHLLQNDLLRTIVSTRKSTIPHAGNEGSRLLVNHNKLLRLYDGCIGVKTGFTKKSGRCLVSAAEKNGVTLIAVTLNAPDDWNDHTAMFDYGFTQFESVLLCEKEAFLRPMPLAGGTDDYVMLCNRDEVRLTLPVGHSEITHTVEAARFEYAPISAGEILGKVVYRCDTDQDGKAEIIAEVPLHACYSVERNTPQKGFWAWLKALLKIK